MTAPTLHPEPCAHGESASDADRWVCLVCGWTEKRKVEHGMTAPTADEWSAGIDFLNRLVISDSHRSDRAQALLDGIAAVTAERDYERTQHDITKQTLDQAWEELHASKQMHEQARSLLGQTLTERDQARDSDTVPIVEYEEAVVKRDEALAYAHHKDQQLADAPHQLDCSTLTHAGDCDCWKAGLRESDLLSTLNDDEPSKKLRLNLSTGTTTPWPKRQAVAIIGHTVWASCPRLSTQT